MEFERGQWCYNSTGQWAEILAVDAVRAAPGSDYFTVVAYRYKGREFIHIRKQEDLTGWRIESEAKAGDAVRCKRVVRGVRVGSGERYVVSYISDAVAAVKCYRADGSLVTEIPMDRSHFDATYEVDTG